MLHDCKKGFKQSEIRPATCVVVVRFYIVTAHQPTLLRLRKYWSNGKRLEILAGYLPDIGLAPVYPEQFRVSICCSHWMAASGTGA